MKFIHYTLSLLSLLSIVGCPQPLPDRHLKSELGRDEITGVWALTGDSLRYLVRDGYEVKPEHKNVITFMGDGTFTYQSALPEFRGGNYLDVNGVWDLKYDAGRRRNLLNIKLQVNGATNSRGFWLSRDEKGLVLWEYYGDPDELQYLEYRKSAN